MKISVVIPIYNHANIFLQTLQSIINQTYNNYEIIVGDNASTDNLSNLIKKFKSEKLKYIRFHKYVSGPENFIRTIAKAKGQIIFLLGADDIIAPNFFERIIKEFKSSKKCFAITRAYYWCYKDITKAVRVESHIHKNQKNTIIINLNSKPENIIRVLSSAAQFSGVAFKNFNGISKLIRLEPFTGHIELMVDALKKGDVHFLSGFPLAVRIAYSHTRKDKSTFSFSPTLSWKKIIDKLIEFKPNLNQKVLYNWVYSNSIGLLQIKNYGSFKLLLEEINIMIKHNSKIIYDLKFILIVLLCFFIPTTILRWLVDFIKFKINSLFYQNVTLDK